jgi:uncharacterized spore protein YtfJ
MKAQEIIQEVKEKIEKTVNIKAIFSEPIEKDGITIVNVAKIKYAGAGGGGIGEQESKEGKEVEGSGMGLGLSVKTSPVGYIEIKNGSAEFIPIIDQNQAFQLRLVIIGLAIIVFGKVIKVLKKRK